MRGKSDLRKIGVLRANAIGDFIVTLPALEAIKNTYPQGEIVLLGSNWHKKFLEESENGKRRTPVDRVLVIPPVKGLREEKDRNEDPVDQEEFFRKAREENFDILLNFQGKGIAAIPFLKKIGAKFIGGLGSAESEKVDQILHHYYYQPEVVRYLEVTSLIDVKPTSLEPKVFLLEKDVQEANKVVREYALGRFVVFHPSGTDKRRMWSPQNFARLADELSSRQVQIVCTGTSSDKNFIQEIFSHTRSNIVDLSDKLSLGGLGALFHKALLTIAIDTGPLHLAQAVGARTIGLYWAPNMINWSPQTRKNHRPVICWELHCPQCGIMPLDPFPFEPLGANCDHNYSFLDGITVSQVVSEADYMLKNII